MQNERAHALSTSINILHLHTFNKLKNTNKITQSQYHINETFKKLFETVKSEIANYISTMYIYIYI